MMQGCLNFDKILLFWLQFAYFLTRFRYFVVKMGISGEICVFVWQVLAYFC